VLSNTRNLAINLLKCYAITATADDWKVMAETYKQLTKGTSAKPTGVLIERLNALFPFSEATGILDNGCGPAPIMSRIIEEYGSSIPTSTSLTCTDFAPAMIEQVNSIKKLTVKEDHESLWSRVHAEVLNAMDLHSLKDNSYSHVAAGWVSDRHVDIHKTKLKVFLSLIVVL
jgi:ubiquinone/menaquinone biosynthesis C-methylase UbiE